MLRNTRALLFSATSARRLSTWTLLQYSPSSFLLFFSSRSVLLNSCWHSTAWRMASFSSRGGAADRWRIRLFVLRGRNERERATGSIGKEAYGGRSKYGQEGTGGSGRNTEVLQGQRSINCNHISHAGSTTRGFLPYVALSRALLGS